MANDHQMWGIHGGRTGDADTLFCKEDVLLSAGIPQVI